MRPVMLEMHGFASFREPSRVDFDGADFFALIGPTGSGKSTVIDAMTFALYGSVPRWGRKGMVSLALAPTVDRGTVKLIFEAGRDRYVAARELRRTGGRVSQRAASLERLADPSGLALPGESTVPLAKDVDGVTDAVGKLLGLSYEDFTQCVVLPQGKFQEFLHAEPRARQKILLRLLGAEHYDEMMKRANQKASDAGLRAETIALTLAGYADATPEALASAEAAEAALGELSDKVTAALPEIAAARTAASAASGTLEKLRAEQSALSSVTAPPDVSAVDAGLTTARGNLADLRAGEQKAEEDDSAARAALADGPRRAPLELTRRSRAERRRIAASVPDREAAVSELSARAAGAAAAVAAAERDTERARDRRDAADRAVSLAGEQVTRLRDEHGVLSSVTAPPDVSAVDAGLTAARDAVAAAGTELRAAEQAEAATAAARSAAGPQAPLLTLLGDTGQLRTLLPGLDDARRALDQARTAGDEAARAVTAAEETLRQRRAALEDARNAHTAGKLRPHLAVGEPCPVCEQTVTTLPEVVAEPEIVAAGQAARTAADEAEKRLTQARAAAAAAQATTARAESTLDSALTQGNALLESLGSVLGDALAEASLPAARRLSGTRLGSSGSPAADLGGRAHAEAEALLSERERIEREADQAARAANAARARHRDAQAAQHRAETDLTSAREKLRAARDPLVRFGAPALDTAGTLARTWETLTAWAGEQAAERSAGLAAAAEAEETARAEHATRTGAFTEASQALERARQQAKTAGTAEQKARAELDQATARIAELDTLLDGQPDEEEIGRLLGELDRLEASATAAGTKLHDARAARARGETELAAHERTVAAARANLSKTRDRVVSLGAPALDDTGSLLDGWTALVTWAREQAAARDLDIERATAGAERARAEADALAAGLAGDLTAAGVTVEADRVADTAQAAVAAERERARYAVRRITERQAEAAGHRERRRAAEEEQQVAKLLGDLLRANAFQRWLVTEALDDLVTHASATLSALSSGQFDLTYDDGEFFVIDHADADTRRSVRTLSGGETFQASLALALALSSQISALSAAGAVRLDSIFLDEGFGTLDPETLDVVATTLETLAQGDRMVGVVTHVGALAERVPVRFRVSRDPRTSTVTREGPDLMSADLTTTEELA